MGKTGVFGGLVREISKPELPYTPKTLELRRIDQVGEKTALGRSCVDADDVVDGVAVISLRAAG